MKFFSSFICWFIHWTIFCVTIWKLYSFFFSSKKGGKKATLNGFYELTSQNERFNAFFKTDHMVFWSALKWWIEIGIYLPCWRYLFRGFYTLFDPFVVVGVNETYTSTITHNYSVLFCLQANARWFARLYHLAECWKSLNLPHTQFLCLLNNKRRINIIAYSIA